ncbi:hypothetical protein GCM10010317_059910 [Streptomyces mirabilis]|nr:hypothetical protein GCM10010317_059910 [Streptomyces mirabilis]
MPAEVLTVSVRRVTVARAATRRERIRRVVGCIGCMQGPFAHGSRPVTGCTLCDHPVTGDAGARAGRARTWVSCRGKGDGSRVRGLATGRGGADVRVRGGADVRAWGWGLRWVCGRGLGRMPGRGWGGC